MLNDERLDGIYPGLVLARVDLDTPYSFIAKYIAADGRVFGIRHSLS